MGDIFCVMNMAKRHRSDVRGLQDEANRAYEDESQYKGHVDLSRSKDNVYFARSDDWHKSIDEALKENDVRENPSSVVLITSVYAVSPEWFETHTREDALNYFKACYEYEQKTKGVVINAVVHMDEDSPHMQVATVPIVDVVSEKATPIVKELDEKGEPIYERYEKGKMAGEIKYKRVKVKDENGNFVTHKGLSAKTVVGNRVAMSKRQTEFWRECGKPFGMKRGEIRIEDSETAKERLTEAEFRAKAIKDEAQKKAVDVAKRELAVKQRETVVKASREALLTEREDFLLEKENWLKMANTALQEANESKADYEAGKTAYETAKKAYEDAIETAELVSSKFIIKDVKAYTKEIEKGIQQECERVPLKSGKTLWGLIGKYVTQAVTTVYMNVAGREAPAVVKSAKEKAESAERVTPQTEPSEPETIKQVMAQVSRELPTVAAELEKAEVTREAEYGQ